MARSADRAPLLGIALDPESDTPRHRQLYRALRAAVLAGRLAPGARLPSTRALADELGCARNTVVSAFEQLFAEGYLEGKVGSGTYVSRQLPETLLTAESKPAAWEPAPNDTARSRRLSARGQRLAALGLPRHRRPRAFNPGEPELAQFPFDTWARLLQRSWRAPGRDRLMHNPPGGDPALRRAVAGHLNRVRGLDCTPEQVLITGGAQQALDIVARLLCDPGDRVWMEEPGYPGLRGALAAAGAVPVPVAMDGEGLSVAAGRALAPEARLAVVAPSHAYPLGTVMSLARRLTLLDWASEIGGWIVEDDYDSEYRYAGQPLAALAGLDRGRRTIYIGTFSKVLFPSLRVGYLVVPEDLADPMARARRGLDDHPGSTVQPALAAFIEEGHFAQHLRRMRRLYAARQEALLEAGRRHLSGLLALQPDVAGMHLVAGLDPALAAHADDRRCAHAADAHGVAAPALSGYYQGAPDRQGLLLGYAAVTETEIARAAHRLARALETLV
ncbi:PLP-dependent aminotransferase family protein [Rhodovibrio salinarum]|uniref:PLP-dependent aminotransferase family protein n=1 Tax=Rhodovibrio salinarum TaxID=1087 RepID=A0A934UZB6_9PROT|nr:PLP-dependent aminotransferase family protein [Rhodovibrio salinarum]MBK1697017.1 PLP-dependent aminotransferase family protein [Rhodovibrio salinarum]